MKRQYLGDSKDSFKWDYHDYLMSELEYPLFNVVLMMTPDDGGNNGKSHPALFPARPAIIEFCNKLREERDTERIKELPKKTGACYKIALHKGDTYFTKRTREAYFSGFSPEQNQIVFLDPDNGLEPEKSFDEKHVCYAEVNRILGQVSNESIITVFQHFRRRRFEEDFGHIRERIKSGYSTAIYWHSLMFVTMSRSEKRIWQIVTANKKYAENKPVKIIS